MAQQPDIFLLDQPLARLVCDDPARIKREVCGRSEREQEDETPVWRSQPREMVIDLVSPVTRLVGVACEAGLGKSYNARWLRHALTTSKTKRWIPILVKLDDEADLDRFIASFANPNVLLDHACKVIHGNLPVHEQERHSLEQIHRTAIRKRREGLFVLILDGLDHALARKEFPAALKAIIEWPAWQHCPIWLTGRPYAFEPIWKKIIQPHDWQFLRVGAFREEDVRQYMRMALQRDFYDDFPPGSRALLHTPRLLKLICGILNTAFAKKPSKPPAEVVEQLQLHSAANVYAKAYFEPGEYDPEETDTQGFIAQGLWDELAAWIGLSDGRTPQKNNFGERIERVAQLLSVIAFHLHYDYDDRQNPVPNTSGKSIAAMKPDLVKRLQAAGICSMAEFERDFELLRRMNSHKLDFVMLDDRRELLRFHDRTTQAFFAALWAVKYGGAAERTIIADWIVDKKGERLKDYVEFWEMAAAMPGDQVNDEQWIALFKPAYQQEKTKSKLPYEQLQWTREMIYHSQRRVREAAKSQPLYNKLRDDWRQPWYEAVCKRNPLVTQIIGEESYRTCPPEGKKGESYTFWVGSPVDEAGRNDDETRHQVTLQPFRMNLFTVTNAQYELFEPFHGREKQVSDQDDQPVVNVSFWDAAAFAAWVGCRLPTEWEWEVACRARTDTPYWFGSELNGLQANCYGNSPYGTRKKGPYLGRTVSLQEEAIECEDGQRIEYCANPWGLWHMHGNTWEWCDTIYTGEQYIRTVRGGSWYGLAWRCRAAFRSRFGPVYRRHGFGFRLACLDFG